MSRNKRLTDLLMQSPPNMRRLVAYSRSNKNFDNVDLGRLAVVYQEMKRTHSPEVTLLHVACICCTKPEVIKTLVKEGWCVNNDINQVGSPLGIALQTGNIAIVKLLIELGADVNCCYIDKVTPLFHAIHISNKKEKTCIAAAKLLLESGVSVNSVVSDSTGERAIHIAVSNGSISLVSFLLQNGADVNAQDGDGFTPLHVAVHNNYLEIVKLLILHEPDFYIEDNGGNTPLFMAVENDLTEIIRVLVQGGCDVNSCSSDGSTSAFHFAVFYCKLEMVKLLISLGANPNKALPRGITPLHMLAAGSLKMMLLDEMGQPSKYKEVAECLVHNGAVLNTYAFTTETPLQVAVRSGFLNLAKIFVKLGADFNFISYNGDTLFHKVVLLNRDLIIVLLQYGADYTINNNDRLTPYHFAISRKVDLKYLKCFLKHGCPFDQNVPVWTKLIRKYKKEDKFFTAQKKLFKAIKENNIGLAKKALKEGAEPRSCSENLKYPLHYIACKGYKDLIVFLLGENVPPNVLNERGETPLFLAASKGHYDICRVLLCYGASYNYSSAKCPKTPRAIASESNHDLVVELLDSVNDMFCKANSRKNYLIKFLESKLDSEFDFKIYSRVTDKKGNTVLAKVLQSGKHINAVNLLKMRLNYNFGKKL